MAASALQEYTGKHVRTNGEVLASEGSWLQETVQALGSHAKDPKAAYSLAALFALSTPWGFATPEQAAAEAAAQLQRQQQAAQAATSATSRGSSSLVARLVATAKAQKVRRATAATTLRAVPPFWQLAGFAAVFATGGYMIGQGDSLNGSGVVSAWSLTYILFRTLPTLKLLPRNPLALLMSTSVVTLGLGIHGCHYFDRTSWKGAVPGLAYDGARDSTASSSDQPATSLLTDGDPSGSRRDDSPALLVRGRSAARQAEDRLQATADQAVDQTQSWLARTRRRLSSVVPDNASPSAAEQLQASLPSSTPLSNCNNDRARATAYLRRDTKAHESS